MAYLLKQYNSKNELTDLLTSILKEKEQLEKLSEKLDIKQDRLNQKEQILMKKEMDLKKKEAELASQILPKGIPPLNSNQKKSEINLNNNVNDFFNKEHALPIDKPLKYSIKIPYIGLGTSRIKNIVDVIYNSIRDGLRMIDTAFKYGNEEDFGKGIKKALDDGLCKREELFVIGKVWIASREDPKKAIKETLLKLQLTYLDLYLDHWPSSNNYGDINGTIPQIPVFDFWPKMEALVEEGLTRSIGCSNYNVQSLLNLLSFCKIKPVANEVEFHPYYYQENLKKFCDKENIAIIAYYPLARGNGAKIYIEQHNGEMDCFKEECVQKLAKKYSKTPGQIIINWEVSQGIISIPGTSNTKRMSENLAALDFKMSDEDIKSLNIFGKKLKFCGCRRFFGMNVMA